MRPFVAPGARALDVGAASGELVACLAEHGYRATGLEPDPAFAGHARDRYGVDVVSAGWEDAAFAPESFDLITATHVLEHFRDPAAAIARFAEWLAPGGHLFLSVPNIAARHRNPAGRFHFAHLYNFDRTSLLLIARRAGFVPAGGWGDASPTDVLFAKAAAPLAGAPADAANYRALRRHFDEHTWWRYHCTPTPYRRFLAKLARRFAEHRRRPGDGGAQRSEGAADTPR